MAITRIAVAVQENSSNGDKPIVVSFGLTPAAGDMILLFVSTAAQGSSITTPSGYTSRAGVYASSGIGSHLQVFSKIASGTENSVSITANGSFIYLQATAIVYRGTNLNVSTVQTTSRLGTTNNVTAPTLLLVPTGAVSVAAMGMYANNHATLGDTVSGSGWTERSDISSFDETFYGTYNSATATNEAGTGTVTGPTFTLAAGGAGPATAASLYVYEISGASSFPLLMGM